MPEYTIKGVQYPIKGDLIKEASVAAKLALDMQAIAITADAAITVEGARAEVAAKAAAAIDATAKYGGLPGRVTAMEQAIGPKSIAVDTNGKPYLAKTGGTHFLLVDANGTPYYMPTIARSLTFISGKPTII